MKINHETSGLTEAKHGKFAQGPLFRLPCGNSNNDGESGDLEN